MENPDYTPGEADYATSAARVVRAHARRIADGDIGALADLLAPANEVDAARHTTVDGLRSFGLSWGEIASRPGTSATSPSSDGAERGARLCVAGAVCVAAPSS